VKESVDKISAEISKDNMYATEEFKARRVGHKYLHKEYACKLPTTGVTSVASRHMAAGSDHG